MHLGDLDVAQGVRTLLGLLDGLGQADDAGLHFGQLHRQGLDLVEFEVGHIQRAVGGLQVIINAQRRGRLQREGGQFHAHDAAGAQPQAVLYGHAAGVLPHRAQHDVGFLQGVIRLGVGSRDAILDACGAVDELHHFAHKDVALAVHQVIALLRQRQAALGSHQV